MAEVLFHRLPDKALGCDAPEEKVVSEKTLLTLFEVKRVVADFYSLTVKELESNNRTWRIVLPRWVAFKFARELFGFPLAEIGRQFGGKDHGTVLHGIRQLKDYAEANHKLRCELEELSKAFHEFEIELPKANRFRITELPNTVF